MQNAYFGKFDNDRSRVYSEAQQEVQKICLMVHRLLTKKGHQMNKNQYEALNQKLDLLLEKIDKADERITVLEKNSKVSTPKTSAKQKSSTTTKSSKKTSTKQTKVDPKDFAPKSLKSYKSVKTARAKFAQAVTGKQWVDRDVFLKAVKPFDEEFGTWVAGKGLCK